MSSVIAFPLVLALIGVPADELSGLVLGVIADVPSKFGAERTIIRRDTARGQASLVDLTGNWELAMGSRDGPTLLDMILIQTGENLALELMSVPPTSLRGTFNSHGTIALRTVDRSAADQRIRDILGSREENMLGGLLHFGDGREVGWIARRKPVGSGASPQGPSLTGTWVFQIGSEAKLMRFAMIEQSGATITGSLFGPGESRLTGTISAGVLTSKIWGSAQESIELDGVLQPDGSLRGKTVGEGADKVDWIGKRLPD